MNSTLNKDNKIEIGYLSEYSVGCLDKIDNEFLHSLLIKYFSNDDYSFYKDEIEAKENKSVSFRLFRKQGGTSFSINEDESFEFTNEESNLYLSKWKALPKTYISIDNFSDDYSGKVALDFIKALQKECKNVVFELLEEIEHYIFDDDIQKIEFDRFDTRSDLLKRYHERDN